MVLNYAFLAVLNHFSLLQATIFRNVYTCSGGEPSWNTHELAEFSALKTLGEDRPGPSVWNCQASRGPSWAKSKQVQGQIKTMAPLPMQTPGSHGAHRSTEICETRPDPHATQAHTPLKRGWGLGSIRLQLKGQVTLWNETSKHSATVCHCWEKFHWVFIPTVLSSHEALSPSNTCHPLSTHPHDSAH